MLSDIHYPYNIPFFSDMDFIKVSFQNNDSYLFYIHFVENKEIKNLAGIVFSGELKKFHFPIKSTVAIVNISNKIKCYIKLQKDWKYIYP